MTIAEIIRQDLKQAMRDKDNIKLQSLRAVLAGFTNELLTNGKTPQDIVDDQMALAVIKKEVKKRKDSVQQFTDGGRMDLADNEKAELEILEKYLPEMMSEEKITEIAKSKITEMNISDKTKMGILVGAVMKETAGMADGAVVKKIVEGLFE